MIKATDALHDPALLELMPTAVYVVDRTGRIRAFNSKARELWGRTPKLDDDDQRFCGAYKLFLTDGAPLPHEETPMARAIFRGETCRNMEVVMARPDGSRVVVMVNISPIRDEHGEIVGAINAFQDVTEIVKAREELDSQRLELRKAVAARDSFLSICSHELRTPLTSLKFQSQMARRKLERKDSTFLEPENLKRMVDHNERQFDRLTRLVDDMLDVVRLQTGKLAIRPKQCNLSEIIREAVERCSSAEGESAPSRISTKIEEIEGLLDPGRIDQVVSNLVLNALKYAGSASIEVEASRRGARAILIVRDHGIGIAKKDHARIFERFERAASQNGVGGLGLGLYVTKEIVEEHGGHIRLESDLGQGATFIVELPLDGVPLESSDARVA